MRSRQRACSKNPSLLQAGYGFQTYLKLCEYQLFQPLFPLIARNFTPNHDTPMERILVQVLKNTDHRLQNDMRVNPAFLFAAMLWYPLLEHAQKLAQESGLAYYDAFALAMNDVLDEQCRSLAIPKRITTLVRDIWQLQLRLSCRQGKRAHKLMEHPKFRAAYDLAGAACGSGRQSGDAAFGRVVGRIPGRHAGAAESHAEHPGDDPAPRRARQRRPRRRAPRKEGA